jgi:multimeric flavodoxin WrbA
VSDDLNEASAAGVSVIALNCSLKPSPERSSTQRLIEEMLQLFEGLGARGEQIRIADHDVQPGVDLDMGPGDAWPAIRTRILASDVLLLATPVWLGHPSSLAQRVLERLDAELSETDAAGRPLMAGKAAIVGVVGNEDGAHKVIADVLQALDDVGFTVPSQGASYWNGAAMETTDYIELDQTPETTASASRTAVRNAVHLARLLKQYPYPSPDDCQGHSAP